MRRIPSTLIAAALNAVIPKRVLIPLMLCLGLALSNAGGCVEGEEFEFHEIGGEDFGSESYEEHIDASEDATPTVVPSRTATATAIPNTVATA